MKQLLAEGCDFEKIETVLLEAFPSLSRLVIESRPTYSGKQRTWVVMISLKSGHCVQAVKPDLNEAVLRCVTKLLVRVGSRGKIPE